VNSSVVKEDSAKICFIFDFVFNNHHQRKTYKIKQTKNIIFI